MTLYLLIHHSYDEGKKIIGIYSTEEKAKDQIAIEIDIDKRLYPTAPARFEQKEYYYDIINLELDESA